MSDWDISGPGEGTGGDPNRWTNSNHLHHEVMFIEPVAEERTSRPKEGKTETYTVALTTTVVCFTCNRCWTDVDVGGKALAPRLLSAPGKIVVTVLEEGEKGEYPNAPIIPTDPDAGLEDLARTVLKEYAHTMPSGRILFDDKAFNEPAAESTPDPVAASD
jgi:hypothetical protein